MLSVVVAILVLCALPAPHARSLQPQGVTFDESVSLQNLYYAYAAFCLPEQLAGWKCQWCRDPNFVLSGTVYDNITEAYGYVGYNPVNGTIVVAFRGTSNTPNWIDDFDFVLVDFPGFNGSKIHQGFYFAWRRLHTQVYSLIDEIMHVNCTHCVNVTTTGHSLGAALSGVAAIEIALAYADNLTVAMSNFGMPRIGNPDFALVFAAHIHNSQRMVHQNDIVPHVPFIDIGYHHPPYEIWDLSNNTALGQVYIVCNESGEDPHCSDSVPALEWKPSDHMTYMGVDNNNCGN